MKLLKNPIKYGELKKALEIIYEKNGIGKKEEIPFLIRETLKVDETFIILNGEKILKNEEVDRLNEVIRRRLSHEPLQYILGYSYFYRGKFFITKDVLIPRKETEFLVEETLNHINFTDGIIIEIGTGHGAVLISILKECIGRIRGIGTDISEKALKVAKKNVEIHRMKEKISLICCDLLDGINLKTIQNSRIILSNPPYISRKEFENLEEDIKIHEPRIALYGGIDGLFFYKKILNFLKKINYKNILCLEIGYNQFEDVREMGENLVFKTLSVRRDYLTHRRIIVFGR